MATSADINPGIISAAPVDKTAMRQQLQNIKDALAALETTVATLPTDVDEIVSINSPWVKVAEQYLLAPATNVVVPLSGSHQRWRVEFQAVRAVGADAELCMRYSVNEGTSYVTAAASYSGAAVDSKFDQVTAVNLATGDGATHISGVQLQGVEGVYGHLEFIGTKTRGEVHATYYTTGTVLRVRRGSFVIGGSATHLQFFMSAGAQMQAEALFVVLGRS